MHPPSANSTLASEKGDNSLHPGLAAATPSCRLAAVRLDIATDGRTGVSGSGPLRRASCTTSDDGKKGSALAPHDPVYS